MIIFRKLNAGKVVIRRINLFEAFQVQQVDAKVEKKPDRPRKAALSVSHGGPTTILKKASAFVEKNKLDSLFNMNMIFENINKNKKVMKESSSRGSEFTRGLSPLTHCEDESSKINKSEKRIFANYFRSNH